MFQALYVSQHAIPVDDEGRAAEFSRIASAARARNERVGVTGILVCASTWFCQVLEGPPRTVAHLLLSIVMDQRHFNASILGSRFVPDRLFPDWGMAAMVLTPETIASHLMVLERGFSRRVPPVGRSADEMLELCVALYQQRTRALVLT